MAVTPSPGSAGVHVGSVREGLELDDGRLGDAIGVAWNARTEWMHRRVDSLTFENAETVHVHISIDFTIPAESPEIGDPARCRSVRVVPLTLLKKGELTLHFDLYDGQGRSVPRLRAEDAAEIAGEMLVELWRVTLEGEHSRGGHDPSSCPAIAATAVTLKGVAALGNVTPLGGGDIYRLIQGNSGLLPGEFSPYEESPFLNLAREVTQGYFLCALVAGRPGDSGVIKIGYDINSSTKWDRRFQHRFLTKLGWRPWLFEFPVRAADPETYHCEITVPEGVDIFDAEIRADPDFPPGADVPPAGPESDLCIQLKVVNRVPASYKCAVRVWLRVAPTGWLAEAMVAGFAIVFTLAFMAWASVRMALPDDKEHPPTDIVFLAGTVLLALVAALAALLSKNEEHRLKSKMLSYTRLTMVGMVGLQFVAVLVLVLGRDQDLLHWWFVGLAGLEGLLWPVLLIAWVGSLISRSRRNSRHSTK